MAYSNENRQEHLWQTVHTSGLPAAPVTAPGSTGLLALGATPGRSREHCALAGSRRKAVLAPITTGPRKQAILSLLARVGHALLILTVLLPLFIAYGSVNTASPIFF